MILKNFAQVIFLGIYLIGILCLGCRSEGYKMTDEKISIAESFDEFNTDTLGVIAESDNKVESLTGDIISVKKVDVNKDSINAIRVKKIEKSINKDKTCEEMIEEYEKLVNDYISTESITSGEKIQKWAEDILHINCIKSNLEYKKRKELLDAKLE